MEKEVLSEDQMDDLSRGGDLKSLFKKAVDARLRIKQL